MFHLFPSKKQWRGWSLPSKLTCIGTYAGVIAIVLTVAFYMWPLPSEDSLQRKMAERRMDQIATTLPSAVAEAVEQKLNQMDTNRVRVETLTTEVKQLRAQGDAYKQELSRKENELEVAVATIKQLQASLAAIAPIQQLTPLDQARVTNAVAQAQRASVFISGQVRMSGSVQIH